MEPRSRPWLPTKGVAVVMPGFGSVSEPIAPRSFESSDFPSSAPQLENAAMSEAANSSLGDRHGEGTMDAHCRHVLLNRALLRVELLLDLRQPRVPPAPAPVGEVVAGVLLGEV